jgi:hypothetical protein
VFTKVLRKEKLGLCKHRSRHKVLRTRTNVLPWRLRRRPENHASAFCFCFCVRRGATEEGASLRTSLLCLELCTEYCVTKPRVAMVLTSMVFRGPCCMLHAPCYTAYVKCSGLQVCRLRAASGAPEPWPLVRTSVALTPCAGSEGRIPGSYCRVHNGSHCLLSRVTVPNQTMSNVWSDCEHISRYGDFRGRICVPMFCRVVRGFHAPQLI